MKHITVFDSTGKAVAYKGVRSFAGNVPEGQKAIEGRWPADTYYWQDGPLPSVRPSMECSLDKASITADGVDVATLSGVPEGAEVRFGQQRTVADADGIVELTSDTPAILRLRVRLWPYKDWEAEIEAS